MLRNIDKNIWVGEQPLRYFGLSVGTRMTVIRLRNGELIVISPIQADNTIIQQLNQLGDVSYIIAPNLYHSLFVSNFQAFYPKAKLFVAPGLERKRPELNIDKIIQNNLENFGNEIECLLFDGFRTFDLSGASLLNEYVFFHPESHTLVLTDTAFHFDDSFSQITQLAAKVMGGYKKLSPSILERFATSEKQRVKQSVQKVLTWDFRRVIMAHGSIVEHDAKRKFKEGYEWFLNSSL